MAYGSARPADGHQPVEIGTQGHSGGSTVRLQCSPLSVMGQSLQCLWANEGFGHHTMISSASLGQSGLHLRLGNHLLRQVCSAVFMRGWGEVVGMFLSSSWQLSPAQNDPSSQPN